MDILLIKGNKMKFNYLLFLASILFFVGCSSTYTVKNFSSKEKFYKDFNNSVRNKVVKITLTNDSSFSTLEDTRILSDSIFFTKQVLLDEKIETNEIKNIKYLDTSTSNLAAIILLNNGKVLKAKKADLLAGSSINVLIQVDENENLLLNNIKNASYINHWLGVPIGLLGGTALGYFTLGIVNSINPKGNNSGLLIYPAASILIGGILGWIVGHNYTYQFNP